MRIALTLVSALAATALVATTALADDGKMYPGTTCVADNDYVDHAWGRAWNTYTNTNLYECPVIRDEQDYGIAWGRVWAVDQHPQNGYDVSCSVNSMYSNQLNQYAYQSGRTSGSNPAPQAINLGSLSAPQYGYYYMSCNVPGTYGAVDKSAVISYYFQENN